MSRCKSCFEEIKNELEVCPFCGYVDGSVSNVENSITIGSILSERYQIGKVIESDNSSITYLAWDKNSDMKFSIKEFFPKDLVNRKSNSSEIAVKGDKKQLFDNGFNEFVAEAKRMYAGNGSAKLYDCIAVNNTAYMILEAPNQTDGFNPFKSVKNDVIDSNPSIDSSNGINIIKTGGKDRNLKQHIKSIPLWAKIVVPVLIIVGIAIAILSKMGSFTSKNDVDEIESEAAITENTVESTNTVVDAEVLVLDGNSYACYSGYETWEDARDYCESLGGHLAVISSQRENDALYTFSLVCGYDNVYIGYSDAGHEGDWQWVNGEESAYTNWNSGEPNGFTQLENYAVMSTDGKWFDADYTPRYEGGMVSFICEWDYEVSGTSVIPYEELTQAALITNEIEVVEDSIGETESYIEATESTILEESPDGSAGTVGTVEDGRYYFCLSVRDEDYDFFWAGCLRGYGYEPGMIVLTGTFDYLEYSVNDYEDAIRINNTTLYFPFDEYTEFYRSGGEDGIIYLSKEEFFDQFDSICNSGLGGVIIVSDGVVQSFGVTS